MASLLFFGAVLQLELKLKSLRSECYSWSHTQKSFCDYTAHPLKSKRYDSKIELFSNFK